MHQPNWTELVKSEQLDQLGKVKHNVDISRFSWFGTGGTAKIAFYPKDETSLSEFFQLYQKIISKYGEQNLKIIVLGNMSNILFGDEDCHDLIIKLAKGFNEISIKPTTTEAIHIKAGCATLDKTLSEFAMNNELSGLEFLSGIPGSLGGAIKMNAGCFGSEIKDVLTECHAVDYHGNILKLSVDELNLQYRKCELANKKPLIFTSAALSCQKSTQQAILHKIEGIRSKRESSQPTGKQTGGSTFKNPETGKKAWQLIQEAGLASAKCGGAHVSPIHSNFIINKNGTSADIDNLINKIANKVKKSTGVSIEAEIEYMGNWSKSPR